MPIIDSDNCAVCGEEIVIYDYGVEPCKNCLMVAHKEGQEEYKRLVE